MHVKQNSMKIYTKTGDAGDTSLFSGKRVRKNNIRIDSYGTVDELNSYLGLIRDQMTEDSDKNANTGGTKESDPNQKTSIDLTSGAKLEQDLIQIQSKLFTIGAILATPNPPESASKKKSRLQIERIGPNDIAFLEKEMDEMNRHLPAMTHFILPGGHPTVSFCHIARCVCRRAERKTVELHDIEGVEESVLTYLNRLSDYLFVLARKLSSDLGGKEIPWKG